MESKNYHDELHKKRLYDETIKTIKLDDLIQYVISTINTKEITIYHFLIGSKMHNFISDPDNTMQNIYPRNHECPQFVKNLFFNPEIQFSPEFYYNLSNHETIIIRQVLFLIDPMYNTYPEIEGLFHVFKGKMPYLITKHTVEHNEFKKTYIVTKIDPIVIPERITEQQILNVLEVIDSFGKFTPILVNIMDCSSSTVKELYVNNVSNNSNTNNTSKRVYITHPDCLIIDTKTQYLPMITLDNISNRFSSNGKVLSKEEKEQEKEQEKKQEQEQSDDGSSNDYIDNNKLLCIRWSNYNEDIGYLEDLKGIMDICPYSKRTYDFLINNYKDYHCFISLAPICKIWGMTRITKEYEFLFPDANNVESPIVKLNLNTMSFKQFASYWTSYETFRSKILAIMDPYFKYNIKKFIDMLVIKDIKSLNYYPNILCYTILDVIKIEAVEIFTLLKKYFPEDKITFATTEYNISQADIAEYITPYGVNL